MSYDSCKLCGKFAKEQYRAMEEVCDKPECPGAAKRKTFREVMSRFAIPCAPKLETPEERT